MQNIEIKLLPRDGVDPKSPQAKENSLLVEIQRDKPGVGPTILKTETILGGEEARTLRIPDDAFLVVKPPAAIEELVYDRENSAAVRPSQQKTGLGVADTPDPEEVKKLAERDKAQREAVQRAPQTDNRQQDSGGPVTVSGKQHTPPVAGNPVGARQSGPGNAGPGPAGPQTVKPTPPGTPPAQGSDKK